MRCQDGNDFAFVGNVRRDDIRAKKTRDQCDIGSRWWHGVLPSFPASSLMKRVPIVIDHGVHVMLFEVQDLICDSIQNGD